MDIEKKRRRIARNAAINGWIMVVLGALCLLASLLDFSVVGILVCLAALASGCMELSGRRRLKQNSPDAGRWLAGSQLLLLTALVLYFAYNLLLFDPKVFLRDAPSLRTTLSYYLESPKAQEEFIARIIRIFYLSLIGGTLLYQGGLCLYYTLATRKLAEAAAEPQGKL